MGRRFIGRKSNSKLPLSIENDGSKTPQKTLAKPRHKLLRKQLNKKFDHKLFSSGFFRSPFGN